MHLVADQLVGFEQEVESALSWTRPNFFALRYELVGSHGLLAAVSVNGIGSKRHMLAETAAGSWKFEIFPLRFPEVAIYDTRGGARTATYYRYTIPRHVRFEDHAIFRFQPDGSTKTNMVSASGQLIYTLEQVEAFPKWKYDLKLEPAAVHLPQLPLLAASACCYLLW